MFKVMAIAVMIVNYDRKMFIVDATGLCRKFKEGGAKQQQRLV
jgi:hypothetical protein